MNFNELKLDKESFPLSQHTAGWNQGELIDTQRSVTASLPKAFAYHPDQRLRGMNAIWVKERDYDISFHTIHLENSEYKSIYELIQDSTSKALKYLESIGIKYPGSDLQGFLIKTDTREWYRATYSYTLTDKDLYHGFNWIEKLYYMLFSRKSMRDAGYKKNKIYTEYKVLDYFIRDNERGQIVSVLVYTYDGVSTINHDAAIKTINAISNSVEFIDEDLDK